MWWRCRGTAPRVHEMIDLPHQSHSYLYRNLYSMTTLTCTNCGIDFEKSKHEIARRKHKTMSQNWFCGRPCAASWGNANRENVFSPGPQFGNQHGRKYPAEVSWYVTRAAKDTRRDLGFVGDRTSYAQHLCEVWTGKCALSGVDIHRRSADGSAPTLNHFFIASVDRIDSSKPYQVGNVQWISLALNHAKSNSTEFSTHYKEFINQLEST